MSEFNLNILSEKATAHLEYLDDIIELCGCIQSTILQNDRSTQIEEKITSIGASFGVMTILGSVLSGSAPLLFVAGFGLSKIINRKIYGAVRKEDDLTPHEKKIIALSKKIYRNKKSKKMMLKVKSKRFNVLFSNYYNEKVEMEEFLNSITRLSDRKLSIKYKNRLETLKDKKPLILKKLDLAYVI